MAKKKKRKDQNLPSQPSPSRHDSGKQVRSVTTARAEAFAGPLPPPQVLEKYNQTVPDAANRIIKMAEEPGKELRSKKSV